MKLDPGFESSSIFDLEVQRRSFDTEAGCTAMPEGTKLRPNVSPRPVSTEGLWQFPGDGRGIL